jgi:hypothetical protein
MVLPVLSPLRQHSTPSRKHPTNRRDPMTRSTLDRSAIQAEVERRKLAAPVAPATPNPARWSAKVFVVPAAVAEALARLATRTFFGPASTSDGGEPHSMRRHRGVYIWRPIMDQQERADGYGELAAMQDVHTAETEIAKGSRKNLH